MLFKKTVDGILASFHKKVTQLENLYAELEDKEQALVQDIEVLVKEKEKHVAERLKASAAIFKLKNFLDD